MPKGRILRLTYQRHHWSGVESNVYCFVLPLFLGVITALSSSAVASAVDAAVFSKIILVCIS